jgi:nucleoside-diphosphate-sugar epimerase
MHILITGGLGFIGSRVGMRLHEQGYRVSVVDVPRLGAVGWPRYATDDVTVLLDDIASVDVWGPGLLDDVDVIVHAAGVHQADEVARDPIRHIEVNVSGTRRMLEAAVHHGVARFVNLSTAKVYGHGHGRASRESDFPEPVEPYALGKFVAEQFGAHLAATTSLEVTSLRPFSVYGPGQDLRTGYFGALLDALLRGGRVVLTGTPDLRRDFVHVDTVIDVVLATVGSPVPPPALLNIGSGEACPLRTLVALFEEAAGRELAVTYSDAPPGTLASTLADVSVMRDFVCPQIPQLRNGIRDTIMSVVGES